MAPTLIPRFGTPTGKVGLSAAAGSSALFLRADASIPLDLTVNATWTGLHTFSGGANITGGNFNNVSIGASTAGSGAFTTLSASGTTTLAALTATTATFSGALTANNGLSVTGTGSFSGQVTAGNTLAVTGSTAPALRVFNSAAPGPSGGTQGRFFEQYVDANGQLIIRFVNGAYTSGPAIIALTSDINSNPLLWNLYGTGATVNMPLTVSGITALNGGGTATTPAATDTSTNIATTAHVKSAIQLMDMGRNLLINGNFAINQRAYASGTALAAGVYGHDRWKAGTSGGTYTFTQGVVDTQITVTANSLLQVVETVHAVSTTYVLSWTGTATARVYQGSSPPAYSAGTSTTINGVTVNYLVVTGLTVGTAINVEFSTGTVGTVQLEASWATGLPSRFERRLYSFELNQCQRYYQVFTGVIIAGYASAASQTIYEDLLFPGSMRATPTVTLSGQTYSNGSALASNAVSTSHMRFSMTSSAAGQANCTFNVVLACEL